jgi:hypothetical protein
MGIVRNAVSVESTIRMPVETIDAVALPKPVLGYFPTTFLERGVAIPFTTPQLAGTRVRPGERVPLELLVPNPAGGRGVYILAWTEVDALCRPSLHDQHLIDLVAERQAITPAAIRVAALDTAIEGLAGRSAGSAARQLMQHDAKVMLETNFDMLLTLLRQVHPMAGGQASALDAPSVIEARARAAVAAVAPELGMSTVEVARHLEELASVYQPLGVGTTRGTARIPALVGVLARVRQEAAQWWQAHPDEGGKEAAMLAMVADLTLSCVRVALADAYTLLDDLRDLMRRWQADAPGVARLVARPEWLMDGWDRIIQHWDAAHGTTARRVMLCEIAVMLPVLPREAADWARCSLGLQDDILRYRRKIVLFEDWRTGASLFDMVARNEMLLTRTSEAEYRAHGMAEAG